MTFYQFSNIPLYHYDLHGDEMSYYRDRLFVILILAEGFLFPALVSTLGVLYYRYKIKERISHFVIFALLNNLLELVLNAYMIFSSMLSLGSIFQTLPSLWSASKICGAHLQQMVVLESVLAVRNSSSPSRVFSSPYSVIISVTVFITFFLCELFRAPAFLFLILIPLLAVTASSWMMTFKVPPTKFKSFSKGKIQEYAMLSLAMFSTIIYLIFLSAYMFIRIWSLWSVCVCLMCLRVITDPLVCLLAYKEKLSDLQMEEVSGQAEIV